MSTNWHLFIYRLPANPSRTRVAIWRELRRLGALPLQQSVVVVPVAEELMTRLDAMAVRIEGEGGAVYRFHLADLPAEQSERLVREWNQMRDHEYDEIVEECETRFRREVEFEIFRENLTGSEAEEIEADLEKIRTWFDRVVARDRFGATRRGDAEQAIAICQTLLDDFVERVFDAEALHGGLSLTPPAPLSWDEAPALIDTEVGPAVPGQVSGSVPHAADPARTRAPAMPAPDERRDHGGW